MDQMSNIKYYELLSQGKIPHHYNIDGRELILKHKRWWYADTNKAAKNPLVYRCKICGATARNSSKDFCNRHVDWSTTSHGSSVLNDEDVILLSNNVNILDDTELTNIISSNPLHKNHKKKTILYALQHHRRKYLLHRYNIIFYKKFRSIYKNNHKICEICGWNESSVDLHHILQLKQCKAEIEYEAMSNYICLCPNHHRIVEQMRKKDFDAYITYINGIKNAV